MTARHHLIESPDMERRVHMWTYGEVGRPLLVFPSNAGVAHEWEKGGMIDALAPLLARGRMKIYCPETNVSKSFSGKGGTRWRMAHHKAYERFVINTLLPWIRRDVRDPYARPIVTGCSVGAMYSSIFTLKYPEHFRGALCLSGKYRASSFFEGQVNEDVYFSDPLAFLPGLKGAALEQVRRQTHLTLVVGQGHAEGGCITETRELGALLHKKRIPNHVAFWGEDSAHTYPWWQKQAKHYLQQMF
ncbi:MAG: alpha/beta hydrolase-fold protein [Labilithrix sp.]